MKIWDEQNIRSLLKRILQKSQLKIIEENLDICDDLFIFKIRDNEKDFYS